MKFRINRLNDHVRRYHSAWPERDAILLIMSHAIRNAIQSYCGILIPIYFALIGTSALQLGVIFSLIAFSSAILALIGGFLGDRYGHKPFLIFFNLLLIAAGAAFLFTADIFILGAVTVLAGIGRGSAGGGAAQGGPFSPVEQALLASKGSPEKRNELFALDAALGTAASAAGAALAGLPDLLVRKAGTDVLYGYQILFGLTVFLAIMATLVLLPIGQSRPQPTGGGGFFRLQSWREIFKMSFTASLNGFGSGFIAGFYVYWFYVYHGAGPSAIGMLTALGFVLSAAALWPMVKIVRRIGSVPAVTASRILVSLCTILIPFMPNFTLAGGAFLLRNVLAASAMPMKQSYFMGIVDSRERSSSQGINGVAQKLPSSLSPGLSGYLIGLGLLQMPFVLAGLFQFLSACSYYFFFRKQKEDVPRHALPHAKSGQV